MIDFEGLADYLLNNFRTLIPNWLPGGKFEGNEYVCGNMFGDEGKSFKVNSITGKWADFATGDKGGDLTSLYAAINGISQKEAALKISADHGYTDDYYKPKPKQPIQSKKPVLIPIPKGTNYPPELKGVEKWVYRDKDNHALFVISRLNKNDGSKIFIPWSWGNDNKWVKRSWPSPRPLYGLQDLKPKGPVLIVEGEKAADAAKLILRGLYSVVTWTAGAQSFGKTDWSPIHNRNVLIWPDADKPGLEAANNIATLLRPHLKEIKILDTSDKPIKGWDAADALDEKMDQKSFITWGKSVAYLWEPRLKAIEPEVLGPETMIMPNDPNDNTPVPVSSLELWQIMGFKMGGKYPHYNVNNASIALETYDKFKGSIWYDEFHSKVYTNRETGITREWRGIETIRLERDMQSELGLSGMKGNTVMDAVELYAINHTRNEPRDWMDTLKWDQSPRINEFFQSYMSAEGSEYMQAVSKNFWVSLVARVYKPGCKADNMIVLEGNQGSFKSTALSIIGGKWFTETAEDPSHKDFYQILQGNLIVEIAELDSLSKAGRNTVKKALSTATDRYRAPYGRHPEDHPRQCIFAGSTNDSRYLDDPTGARRFWPIATHEIDVNRIEIDREQLFAEAVHLFKQGKTWHDVPQIEAETQQEMRRNTDIWEDPFRTYFLTDPQFRSHKCITIQQAADFILDIDAGRQDRLTSRRIGSIFRVLGLKDGRKKIPGTRETIQVFYFPDVDLRDTKLMPPRNRSLNSLSNHVPIISSLSNRF